MKEFDAFRMYPRGAATRTITRERAHIRSRIVAAYRGAHFYDGSRDQGYGGLVYDGRWASVARDMCLHYGLAPGARVLQIGCDKGFLLLELLKRGIDVSGTEVSAYAMSSVAEELRGKITMVPPWCLPFRDGSFDLVICAGPVYSLTLEDGMRCLREVQRVAKDPAKAFISLASYETPDDFWLFRGWTLLGTTILKQAEWLSVLQHVGYSGDFTFTNAERLGLQWD